MLYVYDTHNVKCISIRWPDYHGPRRRNDSLWLHRFQLPLLHRRNCLIFFCLYCFSFFLALTSLFSLNSIYVYIYIYI